MFEKSQEQNVGENGFAVQSTGSVTVNYGVVNPDEIRAIAADTFRAEFYQLLGHAGDIATARAQKVVDDFLQRIEKENPSALSQANEPDFRYALLSAQKAHARAGNEELERLLIELLVQRSKEQQRNLIQIVLSESLEVVSRITNGQIAALSLSFLLRRTFNPQVLSFAEFLNYADAYLKPFLEVAETSDASFSHMAFAGCGVVQLTSVNLSKILFKTYPGIAQTGVETTDALVTSLSEPARLALIQSEHVPGNVQVVGGNLNFMNSLCDQRQIGDDDRERLRLIFERGRLTHDQLREKCVKERPYLARLYDLFDNTAMKSFEPSSVGVAIAHASVSKQVTHFAGPLSIWIQ